MRNPVLRGRYPMCIWGTRIARGLFSLLWTTPIGVARLSHVVPLVLDAELEAAKELGALVDRVLEPGMTRCQFIDAVLELRSVLARWPRLAHHV